MGNRIGPGAYVGVLCATLISLFGLVWTYTATQRVRFLPEESGAWQAHVQMIKRCDLGDVAILGSSRANAAFLPKMLGVSATNLAMSGSTPIEAYFEAKKVYACPHPPRTVILGFSAYDWEAATWFWSRSARFGLLNFNDLQDVARTAASLHDKTLYNGAFGSEPPPEMKNFLYSSHFPPYDFASLMASKSGRGRRKQNLKQIAETLATNGQHIMYPGTCATKASWEAYATSFAPNPLIYNYANRLLTFLQSKGVTVLLVSPPINELDFRGLHANFASEYNVFLDGFAKAHPNFRLVGPAFSGLGMCYFADPPHLNQAGAELFSRAVRKMISADLAPASTASSRG